MERMRTDQLSSRSNQSTQALQMCLSTHEVERHRTGLNHSPQRITIFDLLLPHSNLNLKSSGGLRWVDLQLMDTLQVVAGVEGEEGGAVGEAEVVVGLQLTAVAMRHKSMTHPNGNEQRLLLAECHPTVTLPLLNHIPPSLCTGARLAAAL